ncbi:SDR family oxidoreductase [Sphingosinicella terrae]|uniref:SDR family oxidoreductase n=1 Tax=Sphingosinicella terrae TaxID=2172047 RepID=UPI000E0CC7AF|nr:SDR family oxidoreductase [Sphingosinicella terrae]
MPTMLITGGARGIGRATALLAAERGWSVALNYRANEAAAREVVASVEARGAAAVALPGDVAEEAQVLALFDAAEARFGRIDAVVVNAGIVERAMPLADMDAARIRRVLEVNTLGALLCAREAARRLPRRTGSISFVSSMAARLGSPFEYVDYAASKGAIDSLTIGLARELGPEGIRVNAVRPGLIETDIHASGGQPDRARRLGAGTPLGRAGAPEEVAAAILWLASEEASYTTGALIDIAGGR